MCSNKGPMRVWKGWDVFEGKFNEQMERFGCTWREFDEKMERLFYE